MRVLGVIDSLDASGGAERSLAALAPELVALGVDLHVAYLRDASQSLADPLRASGATVHSLVGTGGRVENVRRIAALTRALRPDLVHTTLYEADVAGRVAARLARTPVVSSFVSDAYGRDQSATPGLPRWKLQAAQAVDALTARAAVRFHAITAYVAEVMAQRLHLPAARIDVVPRGRDPRALGTASPERRARVRRALGVRDDQPLVVAIGRQEWQKGHDTLLAAVPALTRRHPELVVAIAGRPGAQSTALANTVARGGLGAWVRILGYRDDVADLLAAADVFAFPSRWEGLGSTLLEAMALEVPIVASSLPAVREVVSVREARLVPPANATALAAAINDALTDRAAAAERAAAARVRFSTEFTIERTAKAMVAFYERAVSDAGRR